VGVKGAGAKADAIAELKIALIEKRANFMVGWFLFELQIKIFFVSG
jgi:hypothetical protein